MTLTLGKRLSALGLLVASCYWTSPVAALEQPVVQSAAGQFSGTTFSGVAAFKGIRYASAPVGDLRWQPPQPADVKPDVVQVTEYGASCPQRNNSHTSEDCLFLNVFTPQSVSADASLPVFVWIHGGGYVGGSGDLPDDVVARWVKAGMVVVSFNYRLGALGIFSHPQLQQPEGANYSVMDMTAALDWVQQNIARFGGDADKVTIAGNSAGGMAVQMMMVTANSEGTFRGAISQSGYGSWPLPRTHGVSPKAGSVSAEKLSEDIVLKATGVNQPDLTVMYAASAQSYVNAINGFHLPVVDGVTLTDEPARLFEQGKQHAVPYVSGGNSYDGSVYPYAGVAPAQLLNMISPKRDALTTLYGLSDPSLSALPFQHLFGDMRYVLAGSITTRAMSAIGMPGYRYFFDIAPDDKPGAGHGTETGALFAGNEPATQAMQAFWRNFILTGNPNGDGLPRWQPVSGDNENWMVFDSTAHPEKHVRQEKLKLLEAVYQHRGNELSLAK